VTQSRPEVVIIGGGFGGLAAARRLRRVGCRVTLLDRRNHHVFQPLLYQVATAALNPGDIAYPIRAALRKQKNVRVLLASVQSIDTATKTIELENGSLRYDYLILATGVTHSYFGNDQWAANAPGLKSVEDALEIRRRILLAYEAAERETDPKKQGEWMTFAVVGAGPTGVELAGALAEIGRHTIARDFRSIDPMRVRVLLIEGQDRVLPSYPTELSAKARTQLERLGVEVLTDTLVTAIDEDGIEFGETRIGARTVLWAAGVAASPLATSLGVPLDRAGRVHVQTDLSIPDHPEVFVIGDLMAMESGGKPVPGIAPAALQSGRHAAANIANRIDGLSTAPFRYRDKGTLATIGRSAAVAHLGRLRFSGYFAWIFWWLVHVFFLIGFRNRFLVMFSWAWSYITFQRGARLITGKTGPLPRFEEH
jgi:NADH dehydrogenase